MDLRDGGTHWTKEVQNLHHWYEAVIDKSIVASQKKSTLLSDYIKKKDVAGDAAEEIAVSSPASTIQVGWNGQVFQHKKLSIMEGVNPSFHFCVRKANFFSSKSHLLPIRTPLDSLLLTYLEDSKTSRMFRAFRN